MIKIPDQLEEILKKDKKLYAETLKTILSFSELLEENKLYFFEDYTDHGIKHIESLLHTCTTLIDISTFENVLTPIDIQVLILAILVHDIGMHTSIETFQVMMQGELDKFRIDELDEKTWPELWQDFVIEARKFDSSTLLNIFGKEYTILKIPDIWKKETLDGYDKKLIGEFIRRYHSRMAHEIALEGYFGANGKLSLGDDIDKHIRDLIGLVGRSHGMEVRSLFNYLKNYSETDWMIPYGINIVYLMILLRIGDILQIESNRVPSYSLKLKIFSSILSSTEFLKHQSIHKTHESFADSETLQVICNPPNARICYYLKELFITIQEELDRSWAILGEVYGNRPEKERPRLTKRRIKSNIDDLKKFSKNISYIPDYITLIIESNIIKLLVAPLYGNNSTYGVRELLQNAVDACHERQLIEEKNENANYTGKILISVYKKNQENIFEITDNGKGMSILEIKKYFFSIGASYRNSDEWKKEYTSEQNKVLIPRIGRFGIGVLAGFLLGSQIEVLTRRYNETIGYKFEFNLSSNNIDILKAKDLLIGTLIRIKLTHDKFKELIDNSLLNTQYYLNDLQRIKVKESKTFVRYSSKFNWDLWYTLSKPQVLIKINDNKAYSPYNNPDPSFKEELPDEWCTFYKLGFEKINWTFSNNYSNRKLTVNGIIIPDGYHINSNYIDKEPLLSVFDFNGNINISLNRNTIEGNEVPFNKELRTEIYKHLLAGILLLEIKQNETDKFAKFGQYPIKIIARKYNVIKHPGFPEIMILYGKNGYIVNLPAFFLKVKDFNIVNTDLQPEITNIAELEYANILFNVVKPSVNDHNKQDDNLMVQNKNEDVIKFMRNENHSFSRSIRERLNINTYDSFYIKELILGEESLDIYSCYEGILGNDWFIPYNFEERVVKFKGAYKLLEKYFRSSSLSCGKENV